MLKTENKSHKSDLPATQKPIRSQGTSTNLQYLIIVIIRERQSGTTNTLCSFSLEHEELRAARKRIYKFFKKYLFPLHLCCWQERFDPIFHLLLMEIR